MEKGKKCPLFYFFPQYWSSSKKRALRFDLDCFFFGKFLCSGGCQPLHRHEYLYFTGGFGYIISFKILLKMLPKSFLHLACPIARIRYCDNSDLA